MTKNPTLDDLFADVKLPYKQPVELTMTVDDLFSLPIEVYERDMEEEELE